MKIQISEDEARKRIDAVNAAIKAGFAPPGDRPPVNQPGAISEAAKKLGLSRTTLQSSLAIIEKHYGLKVDEPPPAPKETVPEFKKQIERDRYQDTQKRLIDALREIGELRAILDLREKTVEGLEPPGWTLQPRSLAAKSSTVPVFFGSDFQVGEIIKADELDYPNSYNPDIFRKRIRRFLQDGIALCDAYDPKNRFPGVVYLRGGDAISGDIHEELAETQDLTCVEQTKVVAEEEIRTIEVLLDRFGKVVVHSIPGNHDRTTKKPRAKRYVDLSYDDLALFAIKTHFAAKKEKRVTFFAPRSGDSYFRIFGRNFLLTHGDAIGSRGGQGFIGPVATVARGVQKIRAQYAKMGKPVDHVLMGHFHVAFHLPGKAGIVNGSVAGFNEYAKRVIRAEPELPSQSLMFVDPKWGLTDIRNVLLEDPPETKNHWTSVMEAA